MREAVREGASRVQAGAGSCGRRRSPAASSSNWPLPRWRSAASSPKSEWISSRVQPKSVSAAQVVQKAPASSMARSAAALCRELAVRGWPKMQ